MGYDGHIPRWDLYAKPLISVLLVYGAFDVLVARHTKARWFTIHVLANAIVVACTWPSVAALLYDPLAALPLEEFSAVAMAANLAVHIYHVAFFDDLHWIDWVHHGTMTGIVTPLVMTYDTFFGNILDGVNFFICGLPGGLDYLMLVFVKHKWLSPIKEKEYNTFINTWIRSPGIIFICSLGFVQSHMKDKTLSYFEPAAIPEFTILLLLVWNSQYFAARVIGNYYVRQYQEDQKLLASQNGSNPLPGGHNAKAGAVH